MPLMKSASKKAFGKNVETEMEAGKPQKQSLAIAFSTQRHNKKKKMAYGGKAEADGAVDPAPRKPDDKRLPEDEYMAGHFADGGEVDNDAEESPEVKAAATQEQDDINRSIADRTRARQAEGKPGYAKGGAVHPMDLMSDDERATSIADAILAKRKKMADGGMVDMDNKESDDNAFDDLNMDAVKKESYDDDQLSPQPMDSNETGDDREDESENHMDMVSAIRRKLAAKRR